MRAWPAVSAPAEVIGLKGRRIPVAAKSKVEAIEAAKRKPWWGAKLSAKPIYSMGKWWFVVASSWRDEP